MHGWKRRVFASLAKDRPPLASYRVNSCFSRPGDRKMGVTQAASYNLGLTLHHISVTPPSLIFDGKERVASQRAM